MLHIFLGKHLVVTVFPIRFDDGPCFLKGLGVGSEIRSCITPWCRLKQINLLMLWPTNDCLLLTLMPGASADSCFFAR